MNPYEPQSDSPNVEQPIQCEFTEQCTCKDRQNCYRCQDPHLNTAWNGVCKCVRRGQCLCENEEEQKLLITNEKLPIINELLALNKQLLNSITRTGFRHEVFKIVIKLKANNKKLEEQISNMQDEYNYMGNDHTCDNHFSDCQYHIKEENCKEQNCDGHLYENKYYKKETNNDK